MKRSSSSLFMWTISRWETSRQPETYVVFFFFWQLDLQESTPVLIKRDVRRLNTNRTRRSLRKWKICVSSDIWGTMNKLLDKEKDIAKIIIIVPLRTIHAPHLDVTDQSCKKSTKFREKKSFRWDTDGREYCPLRYVDGLALKIQWSCYTTWRRCEGGRRL